MNDTTTDTTSTLLWEEKLSEELWMHVMSFVPPLEVLRSVTHVSKSLHHMTTADSNYWLFQAKALLQSLHRQHPVGYQMQLDDALVTELNGHQWQRLCLVLGAMGSSTSTTDASNNIGDNLPPCLQYGSRLVNRVGADAIRQQTYGTAGANNNNNNNNTTTHRRRVCLASSTEHPTELLENVLGSLGGSSADEIFQNLGMFALRQNTFQNWWSSRPSPTKESTDTLLFTTNCPLALLSDLKWRPLLDPFTRRQAYTWHHAIVKAYRLPLVKLDAHPEQPTAGYPCTVQALPSGRQTQPQNNNRRRGFHDVDDDDMSTDSEDNEDLSIQSARQEATALDRVLQGETPLFESPPLPYNLQQNNRTPTLQRHIPWQHLVFPPGLIANVVTITLVGKESRQFQNSGYYACVEQVKLEGIPLLKSVEEARMAISASSGMSVEHNPAEE